MASSDKRIPKSRPQPISRSLDGLLRGHPGARRARALAGLKREWADIAGRDFAEIAQPERYEPPQGRRPGVLVVKAMPGAALILQHDAPRLIERVNAFLGADAVGQIKIAPGAPATKAKRARLAAAPAIQPSGDRLGDALQRLQARIRQRTG